MQDLTTAHPSQLPTRGSSNDLDEVRQLADAALLSRLRELVLRSAALTATVLIHLGEVDARGLHLAEGYSSLFGYCTGALGLSESAAYKRIQAARLCRRLPAVLGAVQSGRIHLSGLCVLAPNLGEHNHLDALDAAAGRPKRDIEILAERLRPTPTPVPAPARGEPAPGQVGLDLFTPATRTEPSVPVTNTSPVCPPARRIAVSPRPEAAAPSPDRTRTERRVSLVATVRLEGLLDRARALLAHTHDGADTTAVVERALDLLVTTLEKKRFGIGARPRRATPDSSAPCGETADVAVNGGRSRTTTPAAGARRAAAGAAVNAPRRALPVAVRRAVYERDGGRCTFVSPAGHPCSETRGLEVHHRTPWAVGGRDALDNLTLHCRPHNALLARRDFGDDRVAARIRDRREERVM